VTGHRRMSLDLELDNHRAPQAGDIILGSRVAYRVTGARPVESRIWPNRWALTCRRLGPAWPPPARCPHPLDDGCLVHVTRTYRRGETPADHFGATAGVRR
jgi:hypothetical protein